MTRHELSSTVLAITAVALVCGSVFAQSLQTAQEVFPGRQASQVKAGKAVNVSAVSPATVETGRVLQGGR